MSYLSSTLSRGRYITCIKLTACVLNVYITSATDEMLGTGDALGGLINASLGNATKFIIAILLLVKCEIRVVQASLLVCLHVAVKHALIDA